MSEVKILNPDEKRAIEMSQIVAECAHRIKPMIAAGEAVVMVLIVGRHEPGAYNFSGGAKQTHAGLAADPEMVIRNAAFELAHEMGPTIKATLEAGTLTLVDTDQASKQKTHN